MGCCLVGGYSWQFVYLEYVLHFFHDVLVDDYFSCGWLSEEGQQERQHTEKNEAYHGGASRQYVQAWDRSSFREP